MGSGFGFLGLVFSDNVIGRLVRMKNALNESAGGELLGLAVDEEVLFSNHKKVFKAGIKKRQSVLAKKLGFLRGVLEEDERIVCISTGCSPMSFLEQWFMGIWIFFVKRCIFVFTNKRILHIPTKIDYSYRDSLAQILYSDCESVKMKGRTLVVKYSKKATERFYQVAGKEKKKIKVLLEGLLFGGQGSEIGRRTHLCPRCAGELVKGDYTCSKCGLEFKNKAKARQISLFYPGGGYFYTGHPVLGVLDALTEAYLSVWVVSSIVYAVRGVEEAVYQTVFFGILLAIEKSVSIFDSNKFIEEYIPLKKNYAEEDVIDREEAAKLG